MRRIDWIVEHCSAAPPEAAKKQTAAVIREMHKRVNGWSDIGYHFFIRTDGTLEKGRLLDKIGAGVFGFNAHSIHICYAGGLDENSKAKDTRTPAQLLTLNKLRTDLYDVYHRAKGCGHRDFSPDKDGDGVIETHEWMKECPCYDVSADLRKYGFGAHARF